MNRRASCYTEQEKEILEKTVKSIDFDYGYDGELDIDYVVPMTEGFTEFKAGERDIARALEGVDGGTLDRLQRQDIPPEKNNRS